MVRKKAPERQVEVRANQEFSRLVHEGFWSAVAERSGDTAFIFAWARMIYFAEVMQTGAWVAIGAQTLPPKAVSPLRSATALHKIAVFMNQP